MNHNCNTHLSVPVVLSQMCSFSSLRVLGFVYIRFGFQVFPEKLVVCKEVKNPGCADDLTKR
jgi:hypothetical protein